MLSAKIADGWPAALLLVLVAYPLHELGHLLALRALGVRGGLRLSALGLAVRVPAGVQGWRGALVAAAGPAANLLVMWLALRLGWQALAQVNFVLAAVNLLPVLPLDGGRVVLGVASGAVAWRTLARGLLFAARAWALALVLCVYYFGLARWLVLAALWLYLLAMSSGRRLAAELSVALNECVGQQWRPRRMVYISTNEALWRTIRRLSPGWRNVVNIGGSKMDGDELVRLWRDGAGAQYLSEIIRN